MYPNYYYPGQYGQPPIGADPFADYNMAVSGDGDYAPLFQGAPVMGYAPEFLEVSGWGDQFVPVGRDGAEIGADFSPYFEVGADGNVYGPFFSEPSGVGAAAPRPRMVPRGAVRFPVRRGPTTRRVMMPRPQAPAPQALRPDQRRQMWEEQQERARAAEARYGRKAIRVLGIVGTTPTVGGTSGTATATPAISGPVLAIVVPKAIAEDFVFNSLSLGIQPVSANGGPFSAISFSPDLNRTDIDPFDGMAVIAGTPASATFTNFGPALTSTTFRANIHILDETSGPQAPPRQLW